MRDAEEHLAVAGATALFQLGDRGHFINTMSTHAVPCPLQGPVARPDNGFDISRDLLLEGARLGTCQPGTQCVKFGLRHDLVLPPAHSGLPSACGRTR